MPSDRRRRRIAGCTGVRVGVGIICRRCYTRRTRHTFRPFRASDLTQVGLDLLAFFYGNNCDSLFLWSRSMRRSSGLWSVSWDTGVGFPFCRSVTAMIGMNPSSIVSRSADDRPRGSCVSGFKRAALTSLQDLHLPLISSLSL